MKEIMDNILIGFVILLVLVGVGAVGVYFIFQFLAGIST